MANNNEDISILRDNADTKVTVTCLGCSNKKRLEKLNMLKKSSTDEKDKKNTEVKKKREATPKKEVSKKRKSTDEASPKKEKKKRKKSEIELSEEDLKECNVKIIPDNPHYVVDGKKYFLKGNCPFCTKKVSSFVQQQNIPKDCSIEENQSVKPKID